MATGKISTKISAEGIDEVEKKLNELKQKMQDIENTKITVYIETKIKKERETIKPKWYQFWKWDGGHRDER